MEFLRFLANLPVLGWLLERRRSVIEHDRNVFAKLDGILPEELLDDFFESAGGGAFVSFDGVSRVEDYLRAASRAKHDFVVRSIRSHHDRYCGALGEAFGYLTDRLEPSRNPDSDNLHFLPHMNIDMYGIDGSGFEQFQEEFGRLQELLGVTDVHYRRYRRVVHEKLHV